MNLSKSILASILMTGLAFSALGNTVFSDEEIAVSYSLKEVAKKPEPIQQTQPAVTPRLRGETGRVYVAFIVDESGSVANLRCVKTTSNKLTATVLEAVEQWTFKPATHDGGPVKVRVLLPIRVDFS